MCSQTLPHIDLCIHVITFTRLSACILGIELEHELVQGQGACALVLTCVFVAMAHVGWGWSTFCVHHGVILQIAVLHC